MQQAVDQALQAGIIGDDVLGSGYGLEVTLRRGAGGYVCGEEMTLLNTMEGDRREPRIKPPFPTEAGLFGKPTVINNAETLASVPSIMAQGAAEFAKVGSERATGTKVMSLSVVGIRCRGIDGLAGGGPDPSRGCRRSCRSRAAGAGSSSSRSRSIGMVVPDVPANVTALNERFGLDLFRGQSSAGFTAIGDTRGLLLIVKKGRGWLPVNSVKSEVFPVEVTLGHGNPGDIMDFGDLPYVVNLP